MIRVRRPPAPPQRLRDDGATETYSLCDAMKADPRAYLRFEFKPSIYAHHSVRQSLLAAQHRKCAFCEQRISSANYGDVEHFRPKGAWQQQRGEALQRPGYYWLAYEWTNLLVACAGCNGRQHKGNLFPLESGSPRARSANDDLRLERPLLVDPSAEEPSDSIRFRQHIPYAPRENARGRATIRELGLDRLPLRERRRDWYEVLRTLATVVRTAVDPTLRARARAVLLRCALAPAEFSAMARDFIVATDVAEQKGT